MCDARCICLSLLTALSSFQPSRYGLVLVEPESDLPHVDKVGGWPAMVGCLL